MLNGSKIFITNAGYADVFIVIAVTDKVLDKKGRPTKLCSAFIVERTDPGFSVGKAEDKMGIRGSSTCELIFEDCRIPASNLIGAEGKGFKIAMATLDGGRIVGLLLTTLIERITRKKLNPKYEAWINGVGMVLLLLLIAVITFKDIFHLFT